ncbi:MAG: DNA polymerase III subunit delta [Anaerolineae bacterium]|nr:DNA polymerase III subunit delta [Thermoflexales bacterium]MDW8395733.1 DNA polymerase III subunit delta [Anaerolineae bacterium]
MWYVFHGPNTIARDEALAALKARLGEADWATMNLTRLEAGAPLGDLIAACDTMPFLTEFRLVLAWNWVSGLGTAKGKAKSGDSALDKLLAYLPTLPDTTWLVFVEDEPLPEAHPLVQAARQQGHRGAVRLFDLPKDPVEWLVERAKAKGGAISPQAASALAMRVQRGTDRTQAAQEGRLWLQRLDTELDKLLGYANGRPIERQDVELLTPAEDVADIFKFTDAVAARNAAEAWWAMRAILAQGESPLVILAHLARQARLLLQAKEHSHLSPGDLAKAINVHPFVATKLLRQAPMFDEAELEGMLTALLDADEAIKTGRMDENAALDTLVAQLCRIP